MEYYFNLASRGREAKAVPGSDEQARFETIYAISEIALLK
jgi:hypothetical protein